MTIPLAWKNVTHNKVRAAASLTGVSFAVLLIFMQMGFYDACFRSSTMIFDQMDFDVALVSKQYVHLRFAGTIPRQRLYQARAVQGVASATPVYVGNGTWRNPETLARHEILVLGVDPRDRPFKQAGLAENLPLLAKDDTALMDEKAQAAYGRITPGIVTELENRKVEVVGTYGYGSGFISDASIVVSDETMKRLFGLPSLNDVAVGLVKFEPGADPDEVYGRLEAALPSDVKLFKRAKFEEHEQEFFVDVKPLGIMFKSGVLLALVVGGVILYQILSSEIMNHIKEYATLKAIGYSSGYLDKVVLQQATIFAVLGYVPAALLAVVLYATTNYVTNLPMYMTPARLAVVLVMSIAMCSVSGILVSRKVKKADPADLF